MKKVRLLSRMLASALVLALGVCAYPAQALAAWGATTRVSVSSSAVQGNGYSNVPSISSDGRYTAFESEATNLVSGDTNATTDIFVRDRVTGATTRVSVSSAGVQGDGGSIQPRISSDGRYVVFYSGATNLVAGDTNGAYDVFVRDRVLNTTTRVSVSSAGAQGDANSWEPSISGDGRYVAFYSSATNLVTGDTNGVMDIFVRDRVTGATTRVSVSSAAVQGDASSRYPSISGDGRYVAYLSSATNLVAGDTNGVADVFVRDRVAGTTTRMSVDSAGVQGNAASDDVSISSDGRYVAFSSNGTNLVAGDTNAVSDIFVRDRVAGTTTRMSVDSAGAQGNGASFDPSVSFDERRVAFDSFATNLVAGDTNACVDVFVRDLVTGTTTRASVDSSGVQGGADSSYPSISSDGRYVAFDSVATNLVAGDTNASRDIFVHEAPVQATSITIRTTATTARTGSIPILSGAVTPTGMIGKNIVAYVKKPGKTYWTYSSNRTVYLWRGAAAWQYKYYFKPGMVKGYYVFKAVVPAWPGFLTSTSPSTVTIRLN